MSSLKRCFSTLASIAALALPAASQLNLAWSGGVLGDKVEYSLNSSSGGFFGLIPSFTAGPTPLSVIDPNDPRSLSVGLDLQALWQFGGLQPGVVKTISYALPASSALAGITLHAQAVSLPGATTLVNELSNATVFTLTFAQQTVPAQNESAVARMFHSLSTLDAGPNTGRILVVGGQTPGPVPTFHNSVELFDPLTQGFVPAAQNLPQPRSHHSATLLNNGRVLLLGGVNGSGVLATGLLYNPANGQFTPSATMSVPRVMHTATLLADGRVLVTGGSTQFTLSHPIGHPLSFQNGSNTTELYDPVTNLFSPGPTLPTGVSTHQASLLGDGSVLITCGVETSSTTLPITSKRAFRYLPTLNLIVPAADAPQPVQHHGQLGLATGDALLIGGAFVDFGSATTTVSGNAYLFRTGLGTWTPVLCTVIVRCGRVICIPRPGTPGYLIAGGLSSMDLTTGAGVPQLAIGRYDPATQSVTVVGNELKPRAGVDIAATDDNRRLLILGSTMTIPGDRSADIFTIHQ